MSTTDSANPEQLSRESMCLLAVYGTLAPGRSNHDQLNGLSGRWFEGTVHGQKYEDAGLGYPGLVLDDEGPKVDILVFESSDLPEHWARLDTFEGSDYRRTVTAVSTDDGTLSASIYELVVD